MNVGPTLNDLVVAFVMYCDGEGMSLAEGEDLAEAMAEELMFAAADRGAYVE